MVRQAVWVLASLVAGCGGWAAAEPPNLPSCPCVCNGAVQTTSATLPAARPEAPTQQGTPAQSPPQVCLMPRPGGSASGTTTVGPTGAPSPGAVNDTGGGAINSTWTDVAP
jgi:hypothetical protein